MANPSDGKIIDWSPKGDPLDKNNNLDLPILLNGRRQWHPTPVLLPGKSHGWRSLVGCSPRGRQESDTTEQLHFHFPLSCIGEGNDNPLHCSCLENPRDGGAWWATDYGVAQSRTWLMWLSSSVLNSFSCVCLFAALWTTACQAPLSMGYFMHE